MTIQNDLLVEIEAFLPERGITESTFGRLAVNDGKFVRRLRASHNMTLSTLEKASAFIRAERERRPDSHSRPAVEVEQRAVA